MCIKLVHSFKLNIFHVLMVGKMVKGSIKETKYKATIVELLFLSFIILHNQC